MFKGGGRIGSLQLQRMKKHDHQTQERGKLRMSYLRGRGEREKENTDFSQKWEDPSQQGSLKGRGNPKKTGSLIQKGQSD